MQIRLSLYDKIEREGEETVSKYIVKRIFLAIITLLIVCGITFFSMNAIPGGPFDREKATSPAVKATLEQRFNLDKPVPEQFVIYMNNLLHGDFGISTKTGRDIKTTIFSSFAVSARLGGQAIVVAVILGIVLGSIAALNRNGLLDRLIIGVIYGSISGYLGGKVDLVMMRIVDIIYSLPDMLMVVLLSVVLQEVLSTDQFPMFKQLGTNMLSMFMVFALLYWTGMARMVRGQILTIKSNEYVLAAKVSGASAGRIIRKHILPNSISVIIITAALQVPSAIFTESFLSFIGLGVKAPMPSLGSLANAARAGISEYSYKLIFPALMICLITLACNLLGDGLRDAFDPKLRR